MKIESLSAEHIEPYLDDLAALRIEVFREYPYLYLGCPADEARYLRKYARAPGSLVVIARDGERVVGASTAMPLLEHSEAVAPPLQAAGYDCARIYYFGESVLRADYRGRGIGHAFFDAREAQARALGFELTCFCAVDRRADHPRKPPNYVPHDAFWSKRGYLKRPDIVGQFSWRDLDDSEETAKPMVFWLREL